jgi:hypothetical protein
VQRALTSGPRGWPPGQTPWPVGPTLQPLVGWLHGDTLQEVIEGNPKLKVSGGQTPRLAGRPPLDTSPWTPINTPLPVEIKATHTTCSSPLVKVPV